MRLAWWQTGIALNRLTPPEALLLIADDGDPTALYYSQRHGWHFLPIFGDEPVDDQQAIGELERLRTEGASYLAFTTNTFWCLQEYPAFREHLEAHERRVREAEAYIIVESKKRRKKGQGFGSEGSGGARCYALPRPPCRRYSRL